MPETLNLTAPYQATPGTTKARIKRITLEVGLAWDGSAFVDIPENSSIRWGLLGEGGIQWEEEVLAAEADALLRALNTAPLQTKSLIKRSLEWLAANRPHTAGTVSGTP